MFWMLGGSSWGGGGGVFEYELHPASNPFYAYILTSSQFYSKATYLLCLLGEQNRNFHPLDLNNIFEIQYEDESNHSV